MGKALSNGRRLELPEPLAQGERSVEALTQVAGIRLTSVSAHLQILKQARVVTSRREGAPIHYGLAGDDVATLFELLQQVARGHLAEVEHARAVYLGPADTVPLTRQQLIDRMDSTNVHLIDVRPEEEYAAGHIPEPGPCRWTNSSRDWTNYPKTRTSSPMAAAPTAYSFVGRTRRQIPTVPHTSAPDVTSARKPHVTCLNVPNSTPKRKRSGGSLPFPSGRYGSGSNSRPKVARNGSPT